MLAVIAFFSVQVLPGCVVWEIRDEMRRTNAQVGAVQESLSSTNQRLAGVDSQLTGTNERLSGTNERLQGTNSSLSGVEEQLALLREINASMGKLDVHLASLRRTIGAINNMMPFLDLGADAPSAEPGATEPAHDGDAAPADAGAVQAQAAVQPKREVLVGLWVSAYPDAERAMVVLPDGRYILSRPDAKSKGALTERGVWKRGEGTLTLQPDLVKIASPALPLMNATTRSFAVDEGGQVWVYARP